MTCHVGGAVAVCSPSGYRWRRVRHCPTCGRLRLFLVAMFVWYGSDWTCLTCGDRWSDGERATRPFARGWRQRAVARAKAQPYTTKAEAMSGLAAELDTYITDKEN